MDKRYFCIDMKCFYASVECAERRLDPFETDLVVADVERGKNALCLAISPHMKALGVKNRCRLSEIPKSIKYIIAKPRMKKYVDYAADIYDVYLDYVSGDDIHVYSIDESFIDASPYLARYRTDAHGFARLLINKVAERLRIPSTAGIGTNLYLAKIALDITAKHAPCHIGYLDEESYKKTIWDHRPITDLWQISVGTAARLGHYGIYDMRGVANAPEELLYKAFGINAELLIDHAWGREPCTIADIKSYKPSSRSVSSSQILFEDYSYEKALLVMREMALGGAQELMRRKVIASSVGIGVSYSGGNPPSSGASMAFSQPTSLYSVIRPAVDELFARTTHRGVPIRRLAISFGSVMDEGCEGYDLFTDREAMERERLLEHTVLGIKDKFGKNAVLRGFDLEEGATAMIRNKLIGGHNGE
ncbi:MAG: DNA repair protein [Clostridia bacterium]|nr:DNA repair protein [Clostridia bacterium]